jgi:hypothetical protein
MYQSSISLIQDRVREELRPGCVVDVYHLASTVRVECLDLTYEDIVGIIEWAVAKANGEAVWTRRAA